MEESLADVQDCITQGIAQRDQRDHSNQYKDSVSLANADERMKFVDGFFQNFSGIGSDAAGHAISEAASISRVGDYSGYSCGTDKGVYPEESNDYDGMEVDEENSQIEVEFTDADLSGFLPQDKGGRGISVGLEKYSLTKIVEKLQE